METQVSLEGLLGDGVIGPNERHVSLCVEVPPMTCMDSLVGAYINLFTAVGIKVDEFYTELFPPVTGFNHPIEHEEAVLVRQFAQHLNLLRDMVETATCKLVSVRVGTPVTMFFFSRKEDIMLLGYENQ